jgi:GAF domain-containing protein
MNNARRFRLPSLPAALGPKALERPPNAAPIVVTSLLLLAIVCVADVVTPVNVVFEGLAILVVILDAWLIGSRALVFIVVAAIVLEGFRGAVGATAWVTVVIDSIALSAAAAFAHVAATNTAEARRSRERQLAVLLDTARALNEATDELGVYHRITEAASRFVSHGDPRSTMWRLEAGGLRALAERDVRGEVALGHEPFALSADVRSILEGTDARQVNMDQVDDHLRRVLVVHGVRSMALAPVRVDGRPFGAVSASSRDEAPFTAEQLEILTGLADLAGIAVAKARELQRQRDRARVLEVLRQVLVATAAAGPSPVAQRIVEEAQTMIGADTVVLALRERGRAGLWLTASTRPLSMAALDPQGPLGKVAQGGEPAVVDASDLEDSPDAPILGGAQHLVAAPVLGGEGPVGVLAAAIGGDRVTDEQTQLLALLASQVGSALEAAELRGELVESEQALRSLLSGLGSAAILHDAAGQAVEANWAAENLTGVPASTLAATGAFGADWVVRSEAGTDIPLGMRPPAYVLTFDRPLVGLVAQVAAPGRRLQWVRIDSSPILEGGRIKWIVTTFYPVPAPTRKSGR